MALQMEYEAATGAVYPNAYYRIIEVNCHWGREGGRIALVIYKDEAAREEDKQPVGEIGYPIAKEARLDEDENVITPAFEDLYSVATFRKKKSDPLELAYLFIKELPEFEDAIDV
ncbi:hypothetical protein LCGC14_1030400 [marine sediment metagenome]|uniref:Uncharacterized protein n=1 Tax=marine sediment metagenome TaxID=412755 RepID=A0A0F9QCV1_9ZZZZ